MGSRAKVIGNLRFPLVSEVSMHVHIYCVCPTIVCGDGDIRLSDGGQPLRGRLETCFNDRWGVDCPSLPASDNSSSAHCMSLGYSVYGRYCT